MSWLSHIFNKDREPSEWRMRRLVARTNTPEGRREYLELAAKHPRLLLITDKHKKSALYHATASGDLGGMEQLMDAGISRCFYHDAIYVATQLNSQPALDLLLAKGASVGRDHIEVTQMMADCYTEPGPEGEPNRNDAFGKKCYKGLEMLRVAFDAQEQKRALDAENAKMPGPLELADKISVRGPLRLKPSTRRDFRRGFILN